MPIITVACFHRVRIAVILTVGQ